MFGERDRESDSSPSALGKTTQSQENAIEWGQSAGVAALAPSCEERV